jgi:hypothetical protein
MEGNNLIASVKSVWDVTAISYYALPLIWFKTAYPALTGQRGRDGVGTIRNKPLLGGPQHIGTQHQHGIDYLLVGPRTWLLLSQKFGYDVEVPCRCHYQHSTNPHAQHHHHHQNGHPHHHSGARLFFRINDAERVDFVTGRFPYEKYVQADAVVSDEDTTELEEEDEDDDEDEGNQQVEEEDDPDLVRNNIIIV